MNVALSVPRFEERQPAWRNPVALMGVAPLVLVAVGLCVAQVGFGVRLGNSPPSDDAMLLIGLITGVVVPGAILSIHMATRVEAEQIRVKLWPLASWKIPLAQIERAEAVTYAPISDAGGWGLRRSATYGRVVSMYGRRGVALTLRSGERWLLGSQRPEELVGVLAGSRAPA